MPKITADITVYNSMCPDGITYEQFVSGLNRADFDFIRYEPGTRFSLLPRNPLLDKKEYCRMTYAGSENWTLRARICPPDDPRILRILDYLKKLGMQPHPFLTREKPMMFGFLLLREYEHSDFEAIEFLEPDPVGHLGWTVGRSKDDRLKLRKNHLRLRNYLGKADWPWLVVSDDMRQKMEKAGLRRLLFRETEAAGKILKDEKNQIWELDSDLELPPMSPKCDFRYLDGTPFMVDPERECTLIEGFYNIPEFHYTRSAIESVGRFDLARTHEHWGGTAEAPRKLVCSRRFYEFCNAHKVKMNWIPVRIDPD